MSARNDPNEVEIKTKSQFYEGGTSSEGKIDAKANGEIKDPEIEWKGMGKEVSFPKVAALIM